MDDNMTRIRQMMAYRDCTAQFLSAKERGDIRGMEGIVMRMLINNYSIKEIIEATKLPRKQVMTYSDYMARFDKALNQTFDVAFERGILQTAKNMLKEGLAPALIMRITGLPKKQIMALK